MDFKINVVASLSAILKFVFPKVVWCPPSHFVVQFVLVLAHTNARVSYLDRQSETISLTLLLLCWQTNVTYASKKIWTDYLSNMLYDINVSLTIRTLKHIFKKERFVSFVWPISVCVHVSAWLDNVGYSWWADGISHFRDWFARETKPWERKNKMYIVQMNNQPNPVHMACGTQST